MEWLFASWRILCNKYQIYIWALAFLRRPGGVEVKQSFTEACSCTRISRLRLQEKEETKVWLGLPKGRNISLAWYHLAANLFPCHYHQEYPWSWGMIIKFSELFKEPGYTPKLLIYSSLKSFPPHSISPRLRPLQGSSLLLLCCSKSSIFSTNVASCYIAASYFHGLMVHSLLCNLPCKIMKQKREIMSKK